MNEDALGVLHCHVVLALRKLPKALLEGASSAGQSILMACSSVLQGLLRLRRQS